MEDEKTRIIKIVAERSIEMFDDTMDKMKYMGYEAMKQVLNKHMPENDKLIIDPIMVIKSVLERVEASKMLELLKKDKQGYVSIETLVRVKNDKPC